MYRGDYEFKITAENSCIIRTIIYGTKVISVLLLRWLMLETSAANVLDRYESPYWRTIAAARIQVAWRYRKRRLKRAERSRPSEEPDLIPGTCSHYAFQPGQRG